MVLHVCFIFPFLCIALCPFASFSLQTIRNIKKIQTQLKPTCKQCNAKIFEISYETGADTDTLRPTVSLLFIGVSVCAHMCVMRESISTCVLCVER